MIIRKWFSTIIVKDEDEEWTMMIYKDGKSVVRWHSADWEGRPTKSDYKKDRTETESFMFGSLCPDYHIPRIVQMGFPLSGDRLKDYGGMEGINQMVKEWTR